MSEFKNHKMLLRLAWGIYFLAIIMYAVDRADKGKPAFSFLIDGFFEGEPWSKERFFSSLGTIIVYYGFPIICVYLSTMAACVYGTMASNVIEKIFGPPK